jgi:hypothetical protein
MARKTTYPCEGSGARVSAPTSSAFPEEKCPQCDFYGSPVQKYGEWYMRSHKPVHMYSVYAHGFNGDSQFTEVWDVVTGLRRAKQVATRVMKTDRFQNVLEDGTPTVQWVEIFGYGFDESLGCESDANGELVWTGC